MEGIPEYVEVVSDKEIDVHLDGDWQGKTTIRVDRGMLAEGFRRLNEGQSCLMFGGMAFDHRMARGLFEELSAVFERIKEVA